ncbi:Signal transduction histidine kinase [Alteromonadaceae bacterium Bs31]|nr:Signal transduction histidine kinase [Alteromonadaceae bacterium Bs31]
MSKINIHSIKIQILLAFVVLLSPLLALSYFYTLSHQLFTGALDDLVESENISHLISKVEKDVLDLQRNVLIFKETASAGAVDRVDDYYNGIDLALKRLLDLPSGREHFESIMTMRTHLGDFKSNFDIVVGMRNQRSELITQHLSHDVDPRVLFLHGMPVDSAELSVLENYLLAAHNASLSYLTSYDLKHINEFKDKIADAKVSVSVLSNGDAEGESLQKIAVYERNFSRIVSLTRHYVYLINVVMTGSANEILYHSANLDDIYRERSDVTRYSVVSSMAKQQMWSSVLSLLGIIVAVVVAVLFYRRITRPIERITNVFNQLAQGNAVSTIPELDRRDEIGSLASAADVFRFKNEQTKSLLVSSERMVKEQKSLNVELNTEKKRAERALSIKTDFLANMSHELRTPLNSIIGFTVRLLKQPDSYEGRQLKALQTIERNGRHLLEMINDILDLSKIEANKLELRLINVDLSDLCVSCVTQISPNADEKGLEVIFNQKPVSKVETDPSRISQILLNLLSNAVKYTDSGFVRIDLEPGYDEMSVIIKVTDSGHGIDVEDQKKLFQRFEQFDDNTRFEVGQGTGLGLSIVSNLSRLLGTTISVSSEYGKGSCFSVKIPVRFCGESQDIKVE